METTKAVPWRTLTCCCCGAGCRGRQWWNRDTGYGLCPKCVPYVSRGETPEEVERTYGRAGYHYETETQP